ncbi:MAG: hypothetical protein JSS74_10455 [Actinobacteria bacterium]|nr:hypothetical protein [Actinomycetota bacterium]
MIAAAEIAGVPAAQAAVEQAMGRLVAAPITVHGEATSVTAVHAYANAVRKDALAAVPAPPGLNPGAVTDDHLGAAVAAILTPDA